MFISLANISTSFIHLAETQSPNAQESRQSQHNTAIRMRVSALIIYPLLSVTIPLQPRTNDTLSIIGSENAEQGGVPYIVSIQSKSRYRRPSHNCDDSLLDATTVLTAGHCIEYFREHTPDVSEVTVRVGSLVCSLTLKVKYELTSSRIGPQEALSCGQSLRPVTRDLLEHLREPTLASSSSQRLSQMPATSSLPSWLLRVLICLKGRC